MQLILHLRTTAPPLFSAWSITNLVVVMAAKSGEKGKQYIFRRAIFGATMGRDDGHYCDMQSSGVIYFWPKVPSFYFIHWLFIVWDLENNDLAESCLYQVLHTLCIGLHGFQHPQSTKQLVQHWKERQGSNHSRIILYQKILKWLPVMLAYCIIL